MTLYDNLYTTFMNDLSKLEDTGRYFNWYKGYAKLDLPYRISNRLTQIMNTGATSGSASTKDFGDMFDADNVELYLFYFISIETPDSARSNQNITLHFEIESMSMKDLTTGHDTITVDNVQGEFRYITTLL